MLLWPFRWRISSWHTMRWGLTPGISEITAARPVQAALASAATFSGGALLPLILVVLIPLALLSTVVTGASLVALAGLGALAAQAGGASALRAAVRMVFWGALAMGLTGLVGSILGTHV